MGIKKDLGLVGNDFSNVATWFFIAYLIAEVPNGECVQHRFILVELSLIDTADPLIYSILLTKSTACQMAWRKCFPLGTRSCRLRWCARISDPACSTNFPGYFRSDSGTILDAH
jgi:hypothetical protein